MKTRLSCCHHDDLLMTQKHLPVATKSQIGGLSGQTCGHGLSSLWTEICPQRGPARPKWPVTGKMLDTNLAGTILSRYAYNRLRYQNRGLGALLTAPRFVLCVELVFFFFLFFLLEFEVSYIAVDEECP